MSVQVKVQLEPAKIKNAFGLGASGKGRKYLAQRARQRCDKYVPKDTGALKNTAVVSPKGETITYVQNYAQKQFTTQYHHTDPRRGDHWHRRMLVREKNALVGEVKTYLERRPG